jgi:glycosyltransferase involved in cell wall biosynthesis
MTLAGRGEITVLIPTYRRPRLLERAVRSVLEQRHPHVRASVFDNASGDETADVVARLRAADARVRYHCHDRNIGIVGNFHFALDSVETEFFSILCDDDFLLPGFTEAAAQGFAAHPDAAMVCCDVLQMNARGDVVREKPLGGCPQGRYDVPKGLLAMIRQGTPTLTGVVFRREVIGENGGFDQKVGAASDMDYLLRVAARHPLVISHTTGGVFAPESIGEVRSPRGSLEWFWPGWMAMVDGLAAADGLSPQDAAEVRARLLALIVRYLSYIGAAAVVRGHFDEARATAEVLAGPLERPARGRALRLLAAACRRVPGAHLVVRTAFRARAEARHVGHRVRGALLRPDAEAWQLERHGPDAAR